MWVRSFNLNWNMFQLTQHKLFFPTSYKYTLFGNKYFVEIMILHSRKTSVSPEGWIYNIKKENKPSEGSLTTQKDNLSRRLCLEGWPLERCFSWSTSASKLLLYNSRIRFKSQMWCDKIQKKCWQVWKVGEPSNDYFSSSVLFSKVEKESSFFSIQS